MAYELEEGCTVERIGNETIVTRTTGDILVLNEQAGIVLDSLVKGDNPALSLQREYGIDIAKARADTARLTGRLAAIGFLRERNDSGGAMSRRVFLAGMAAIGASLLSPSVALGEESALIADKSFNGVNVGGWVEGLRPKTWIDSSGREVVIGHQINKIAPYGPYAQAVLESICPDSLVQITQRGIHASTMQHEMQSLQGQRDNTSINDDQNTLPDLIIDMSSSKDRISPSIDGLQETTGIPVIHISSKLEDLPQAYRTLGDLLGVRSAYDVADYIARILVTFAQGRELISDSKRKKVYFGQGPDGLDTRSSGTLLDDILLLIGAYNVAHELSEQQCKSVDAALVESWHPDYVILNLPVFGQDQQEVELIESIWKGTPLGMSCNVKVVPTTPFSWLDRSPLTMQTLGALWLANTIYPTVYDYDMKDIFQEYSAVFFNKEVSRSAAISVLDSADVLR